MGSTKCFVFRYGAIITKARPGGNLCCVAQCIFTWSAGRTLFVPWVGPPSTPQRGYLFSKDLHSCYLNVIFFFLAMLYLPFLFCVELSVKGLTVFKKKKYVSSFFTFVQLIWTQCLGNLYYLWSFFVIYMYCNSNSV